MKRLTVVLVSTTGLALAVASVALAGWFGLRAEVEALRSDTETLSTEVSDATRTARAAQSLTDDIAATLSSLEPADTDGLQRQLAGMQEAIRLINEEIEALQQQPAPRVEPDPFVAHDLATLSSDVSNLEYSVGKLCQEVKAADSASRATKATQRPSDRESGAAPE